MASDHKDPLARLGTTESLVDDLVDDLAPVKRWSPENHLAFWLALELLVFGLTAAAALRPDIMTELAKPLFLVEMTLLIAAGGLSAAMALLAAVPGREPSRGAVILALALVAGSIVAIYQEMPAAARTLANAPWGMTCTLETIGVALVPWVALLYFARKGASLVPVVSGGLAGLGAFLLAAAAIRIVCPVDDFWHIVIWHLAPAIVALGASCALGLLLLRAWRDDD